MTFLVQFGIINFSDYKLNSRHGLVQFGQLSNNLFVLIYPNLHSKSCDYLFKQQPQNLFTSSTQQVKTNYLKVIAQRTQHHSFFRNLSLLLTVQTERLSAIESRQFRYYSLASSLYKQTLLAVMAQVCLRFPPFQTSVS